MQFPFVIYHPKPDDHIGDAPCLAILTNPSDPAHSTLTVIRPNGKVKPVGSCPCGQQAKPPFHTNFPYDLIDRVAVLEGMVSELHKRIQAIAPEPVVPTEPPPPIAPEPPPIDATFETAPEPQPAAATETPEPQATETPPNAT